MQVPILSQGTQEKIKPFLLAGMPASNPIDYGGTAEENPHMITECVRVCMEDDQVEGIYITGFFGGFKDIIAPHVAELEEKTASELVSLVKEHQKPLFVHTSFAREPIKSLDILKEAGIPVFESSARTAQCLGAMTGFALAQKKLQQMTVHQVEPEQHPEAKAILWKVKEESRSNLLETESRALLKAYGVPLPEAILVTHAKKAVEVANNMGYPVAMKVVSPDIIHKSDAGGIQLGLRDPRDVERAFEQILSSAQKVALKERILGCLISPMARKGQECVIGMVRDRQFGPVLMFGLGGIFVEVLKDVSFRVAPVPGEDIDEMIKEIKGYKILTGVRGDKPKDIEAIKNILAGLSEIVIANPEIDEVDLNPVIVHENGASIVDSRVILR
jgi:acetyltransferase